MLFSHFELTYLHCKNTTDVMLWARMMNCYDQQCISISSKSLHSFIHPPTHSHTHPTTCTNTCTHAHTHTTSHHITSGYCITLHLLVRGSRANFSGVSISGRKCTDCCTFWSTSARVAHVSQWFWTCSNAWTYKSDDISCKSTFDVKSVAK